jgi:FkbM family methyltransferase
MESTKALIYVYDFENTSLTSYAQNFEDVILRRALRDVTNGFYIDIGAQDPRVDSISRGFYELGWRGLSIEPTLQYAERLREDRPDETILHAAVSDQPGMIRFFPIPDTGSSTASVDIAAHAKATGWPVQETTVAAITLDQVFDSVEPDKEIHWLKIDVEGFEKQVIDGWRASKRRPWIIVMEAINPIDRSDSFSEWEPLLLAKGYQFVHFDGINRYYLLQKQRHRKVYFKFGACLWDNFQLPGSSIHAKLLLADRAVVAEEAAQAKLAFESALSELNAAREKANALQAESAQTRHQIDGLLEQLEQASSDLRAAEQRERRAQIAANRISAQVELERAELLEADSKVAALEAELDKLRRSPSRNMASLDQARLELLWAREELDKVSTELGETAAALGHASFKLERERSERSVQQTFLKAVEADLDEARTALVHGAEALSQARSELSQSQNGLRISELELSQARSELERLSATVTATSGDLAAARNELEVTRSDRDQKVVALHQAHTELELTRGERDQVQTALGQSHGELARTREERDQAQIALGQAHTELQLTRGERDQVQTALGQFHGELARTREERDQAQIALGQAHTELELTRGERDQAETNLDRAQVQLELARTERDQALAELDLTLRDLDKSKSDLESAWTERQAARAERDGAVSDLEQAKGKLAKNADEIALASASIALARRQLGETRAELDEAKFDIAQLSGELAVAGNDLTRVYADRDLARMELEAAGAELEEVRTVLNTTLIDLARRTDDLERSRATTDEAREENARLRAELHNREDQLADTNQQLGHASESLAAKQAALVRSQQDLNHTLGDLASTAAELADARNALTKAESDRVDAEAAADEAKALAARRDAEAVAERRTRIRREAALRIAASRLRWRMAAAIRGAGFIANVWSRVPVTPPADTDGAPDPERSVRLVLGRELEDVVALALTELDALQQREAVRLWPLRRWARGPTAAPPSPDPEMVVRRALNCERESLVRTAFVGLRALRWGLRRRAVGGSSVDVSDEPERLMRATLGRVQAQLLTSARGQLRTVTAPPTAAKPARLVSAVAPALAPDTLAPEHVVRQQLGHIGTDLVRFALAGLRGLIRFDAGPALAASWRLPAAGAPYEPSIDASEVLGNEAIKGVRAAWSIRGRGPDLGGGVYMGPQVASSLRKMALGIVDEAAADEDPAGLVVDRRLSPAWNVLDGAILAGVDCDETGYPAVEIDRFNNDFKGVACTSRHAAKILVDQGLTIPIAVAGLGLDQWERLAPAPGFHAPGKGFCFLHVSKCGPLDGVDLLIESFARSFRSDDNVSLIVKPDGPMPPGLAARLERMRASSSSFPDIIVIEAPLSQQELKSLYLQCQVFVAVGRAQGFCLPLAQALVCEMPAVATSWGGHTDYCDDMCGWMVDYSFQRAHSERRLVASVWVEPHLDALDEALRQARAATAEERAAKGYAGRNKVQDAHLWSRATGAIVELVNKASERVTANATIAVMSSWNVQCGIASHVANMFADVREDELLILAGRETKPQIAPDGPNVIRAWDLGKDANKLDAIRLELKERKITRILIHFNYGFFNFPELWRFLDMMVDEGIIVFIDFHSTVDPAFAGADENFRLSTVMPALRKCHRLMVHGPADLNRLKALGLVDNVMLFPLGVVGVCQAPKPSSVLNGPPLLMTFGFAFPNKGLTEIVEAVGILRDRGVSVRLIMLNAEHPVPASAAVLKSVRAKIDQLNLRDRVELRSEYLPEDVCLEMLGDADLIVNPYQESGESASAAIRYSMATSRPVAVTPLAIFDDLGDAAFRLPGTSPRRMAAGIIEALGHLRADSEVALGIRRAQDQWLKVHDVKRQAARILGMMRAAPDISTPSVYPTRSAH